MCATWIWGLVAYVFDVDSVLYGIVIVRLLPFNKQVCSFVIDTPTDAFDNQNVRWASPVV